ncbi:hypothetical protein [Bordetella hinzii]|uniref:hypothetical protein n=1 Tax=Bordetella hinzii TaxID=103855 RepID=UPI0011529141|nr:hypothetical protein [Bordetella hinzii]
MMQFSEYIILDRSPQAMDPLGFRHPGSALQDLLFPQFTVLTLSPAYLSALCCFLQYLERNPPSADRSLAREVRTLELLWGVANASVNGRVININKFQDLCGASLRLRSIPPNHPLYRRLSYGTLGHYSSAAVRWELVNKSGRRLLPAGERLAQGFAQRQAGKQSFLDHLTGWKGNLEYSPADMLRLGSIFGIDAPASTVERAVWREQIDLWCRRHPQTAALWEQPLNHRYLPSAATDGESYREVFPRLREHYREMDRQLMAIQQFERLGAATQFVFDLHWAGLTYKKELADARPRLADEFAVALGKLAATYIEVKPYARDTGKLFSSLAVGTASYQALRAKVIDHHKEHQRSKGASPILDHDDLILRGGVEHDEVRDALHDVEDADDVENMMDKLQFRYRRQWHFEKCRRWHDWTSGRQDAAS